MSRVMSRVGRAAAVLMPLILIAGCSDTTVIPPASSVATNASPTAPSIVPTAPSATPGAQATPSPLVSSTTVTPAPGTSLTWQMVTLEPDPIINGSTGHPSSAQSIASIGDTLVIGGYRMAASTAETGSGTVWTSSDGSTWSLAEIGRGSAFITVASDGNRVLALAPGASWTTTDGHTWTPGSTPPAPMTSGTLVGLPDGGFLAPGATNDPSACSFWFTADGSAWQARGRSGQGPCPRALASGPDGLVAVGWDSGHGWISYSGDQGATWTTEVSGVAHPFTTVAAIGGGFLATSYAAGSGTDRGQTWRSSDGRSWKMIGTFALRFQYADTSFHAIVRFQDEDLAFGDSGTALDTFAEARASSTGANWQPAPWGMDRIEVELLAATVWSNRVVVVGTRNRWLDLDHPQDVALAFIGTPG